MNIPLLCGTCHQEGSRGLADPRHPAGAHPRELRRLDPRRGAVPEGPDGHRGLHLLPHGAQHPAAHGPEVDHQRQANVVDDLHPVPRADRARAPQGDRGPALGERSRTRSRSASTATSRTRCAGLLQRRHGEPGLPHLPRQARPRGRARRPEGLALRRRGRLRGLDARQDRLRAVPHRGRRRRTTAPCETITPKVDCGVCHAAQVEQYQTSIHGKLAAKGDRTPRAASTATSHHATKSKKEPTSPTFARNVPALCARCHREGEKAAVRIHAERAGHRRQLRRLDPRQGAHRERPRRHRDLRQLPHARTASCRPTTRDSTVNRANLAAHLRQVPPRRRGGVRDEHPRHRRSRRTASSCRSARTATARTRSAAPTTPASAPR